MDGLGLDEVGPSEFPDDKALDGCRPVPEGLLALLEVGTKLDEPGSDCESGTTMTGCVVATEGVISSGDEFAKSDAECADE